MYRLNSEYLVWKESKTVLGEHIRRGKDRVYNIILENTGMPLDVVNGPNSKGGGVPLLMVTLDVAFLVKN